MKRWGSIDAGELAALQKRLSVLSEQQMKLFYVAAAKELAARLLRKVKKRTPVGQYPSGSGRTGGTLRRGWTVDTDVKVIGDTYEITVFNPVEYAPYVEFGHRTANHRGWVQGRFMLTRSEVELDAQAPGILERKLTKMIAEAFSDGK